MVRSCAGNSLRTSNSMISAAYPKQNISLKENATCTDSIAHKETQKLNMSEKCKPCITIHLNILPDLRIYH